MKIRKASKADIDALFALNTQINDLHHERAPNVFAESSDAGRDFLLNALDDTERLFLVATLSDKVVGFLTANVSQNDTIPFFVTVPICRVGTIVIDQAHQSSGIGQALMQACREWAESAGAAEMRLEVMEFNAKAQAFYTKLGFTTQSRTLSQTLNG
ncbi:GNAT family N-acetyltransferase [Ferrimonas marina]|uniref:Ribosomal protein S18 acetylase RimI n=1 Tax=Ferrimonas marina TaxID=299255 RepID=A0A1M5RBY8_9GAMM|nr:GNAT family N-acetyltransferase [Ferrimonas marina]SHH23825.1 Ribosomal protein S18 acetylase RimI [Ferrimonas marina]